jgi:CDP-paratose 2-epimerase
VAAEDGERPGDVRVYVTDASRLHALTDWRPARGAQDTLADIASWARTHEDLVLGALES